MRYSLRTLLIVMLLGGPALAAAWWYRDIAVGLSPLIAVPVALWAFCRYAKPATFGPQD